MTTTLTKGSFVIYLLPLRIRKVEQRLQVAVAKLVIMVINYLTSFLCHFPTGKLSGNSHNQSEAFVNAFLLQSHRNTGITDNNSIILDEPLYIENTSWDNKKPSFDSWKIKAITDYYVL